MPFSFPSSPSVGATSTQNGRSYTYAGNNVWELTAATGGGGGSGSSSGVVILPGLGDPFYSSVSLLLHGDGNFVDKSGNPKTVTANGGATATGAAKIGSGSFSFSGSSQYLSIPYSTDLDLASGDFTVECWAKVAALSETQQVLAINCSSDQLAQATIIVTTAGAVYWLAQDGSTSDAWLNSSVSASGLVQAGVWHHYAGVKSGNTYTLYLNGVNILSYSSSGAIKSKSSPSQIGWRNGSAAYFNGQIDEVRITKAARYNANFAPSPLAYPDSANVVAFVESGVPAAPTGLTASSGSNQAALTWAAPFAAYPVTDYVVQFSSNSGSTWTTFSDGTSASTSATVTGLTNGTAYTFRVAAVNSAGQGAWSTASSSVTPSALSPFAVILTSGTSYTVPSGASSMKVWAVGPGGQDGGSRGHAGAVAYKTWSVSGGQSVSYAIGQRSVYSGSYSRSGSTTVTFGGTTITAEGGGGPNGPDAAATYSGGDGGANGGQGGYVNGNNAGGAVGGNGTLAECGRYPATDVSGLFAAVTMAGGNVTESCGATAAFGSGASAAASSLAGIGGGGAWYGVAESDDGGPGAVVIYFS